VYFRPLVEDISIGDSATRYLQIALSLAKHRVSLHDSSLLYGFEASLHFPVAEISYESNEEEWLSEDRALPQFPVRASMAESVSLLDAKKKMSRLVCQLPLESGEICGRMCWPSCWRRHLHTQHHATPVSLIFVTDEGKLYPANESTLRFLESNRLIGRRLEIATTSAERIRRRQMLREELQRLDQEEEENQEVDIVIQEINSD